MKDSLVTRLIMPDYLFHGTVKAHVNSFINKIINLQHGGSGKDFGTGLYTTTDFKQAANWAIKASVGAQLEYSDSELSSPCVIVIKVLKDSQADLIDTLVFSGACEQWSEFVLRHRYSSRANDCLCGSKHPQIVIGPMADNNTGAVMRLFRDEYRQIDKEFDKQWFYDRITSNNFGVPLTSLEQGTQICFFDEKLNNNLQIVGYCVNNGNSNVMNAGSYMSLFGSGFTPENSMFIGGWTYYVNRQKP